MNKNNASSGSVIVGSFCVLQQLQQKQNRGCLCSNLISAELTFQVLWLCFKGLHDEGPSTLLYIYVRAKPSMTENLLPVHSPTITPLYCPMYMGLSRTMGFELQILDFRIEPSYIYLLQERFTEYLKLSQTVLRISSCLSRSILGHLQLVVTPLPKPRKKWDAEVIVHMTLFHFLTERNFLQ